MLQDEGHIGTGFGEACGIGHLWCEHLQVEAETILGKPRDIAPDFRIGAEVRPSRKTIERVFVPVQLHAHAAHQRIARQAIQLRTDVIDVEIGVGDDGVRPVMILRGLLHPGRFVLEAVVGPVGLHIDRARHAGACEVAEIFLNRIVAPDRLVGAEDARLHRTAQPGQVGLTPDMMMGIDDFGHAAFLFPSERTCETIAADDPPSTRSSTKRRIAINASVCG